MTPMHGFREAWLGFLTRRFRSGGRRIICSDRLGYQRAVLESVRSVDEHLLTHCAWCLEVKEFVSGGLFVDGKQEPRFLSGISNIGALLHTLSCNSDFHPDICKIEIPFPAGT